MSTTTRRSSLNHSVDNRVRRPYPCGLEQLCSKVLVRCCVDHHAGDRSAAADALVLTPAQGRNGVLVGFDMTNTGDKPGSSSENETPASRKAAGGSSWRVRPIDRRDSSAA